MKEILEKRAEINALYQQSLRDDPSLGSNPLFRWQQKQAIKKQYAATKRSGQTAEGMARAVSTMVERVSDTLRGAAEGGRPESLSSGIERAFSLLSDCS